MSKTKKQFVASFVQSSGVTAAAIVMLCVSLGAVMVPGLFAMVASPSVSNVHASANGGSGYGVTVTWDGNTNYNWIGKTIKNGVEIDSWSDTNKQKTIKGLTCGVSHTFKVAAGNSNGGAASSWGSATATPTCPSAVWGSPGFAFSGNQLNLNWSGGAGFETSYNVFVRAGSGNYSVTSTSGTSWAGTVSCGTNYTAYITASANGQTGPATATKSGTSANCPSNPAPSPPPSGGGGGSTSGGGSTGGTSTGGSTSGGSTSSGTKKTGHANPAPATPTPPPAPGKPDSFAADVVSSKIVALSWVAASNADHYLLSRSTDQATWQELSNTKELSYTDEGTEFATTYYYRLQAVNVAGQGSEPVTTQVTTEAFTSSKNVITSQDKAVTVSIPDGAIAGDYNCTLSTADTNAADTPKGQSTLLGPYDLLCVTDDGTVIDEYQKPLAITVKTADVANGYQDLNIQVAGDKGWEPVKTTYDQQKQQLSFTLASAKTFAAFGVKHKSIWGIIFMIFLLLLLAAGAVFGYFYWRRRTPTHAAAVQSQASAEREFRDALAQPDCSHLGMAQQVIPSSQGCLECEAQHTHWNALRICLLCGHVGCSDDSPEQHALKHYQQTGHPIIYDYANPAGNTIGWCYIDQTYI